MWTILLTELITIICASLTVGFFIATKLGTEFLPSFLIVSLCSLIGAFYVKDKIDSNIRVLAIPFGYSILSWIFFIADNPLFETPFHPEYFFLGLLLFGGMFLVKQSVTGIYTLNFTLLAGLIAGIYQLYKLSTGTFGNISDWYYVSALMVISVNVRVLFNIFIRKYSITYAPIKFSLKYLNLWFSLLLVLWVLSITTLVAANALTPGFICILFAFIASLFIWKFKRIGSKVNIEELLLMTLLLTINFQEKAFFQFAPRVGILLNTLDYSTIENSLVLIVAMLAVIKTFQKNPLGSFFSVMICLYIILNQPLNYIYPFIENNHYHQGIHYFPGLWTALLPVPIAVKCLLRIISQQR